MRGGCLLQRAKLNPWTMLALTDPTQQVSPLSPEDGNRSSFRNVALFGFLEYRTVDEARTHRNSDRKHREITHQKMYSVLLSLKFRCFPFPFLASYVTYPLLAVTSCTRLH
jgi:hypothetical protein